jgi:hypothetical protein
MPGAPKIQGPRPFIQATAARSMERQLERRCPMCFEFEQEYYRRLEEARRARELEEKRKQPPAAPAKPSEKDKPREPVQPLPV